MNNRNGVTPMVKRTHYSAWLAVFAALVLGYAVFYTVGLRSGSDLSIHATWAAEGNFLAPRTFFRHGAHPLWHGMVAAVLLTGLPLTASAALVTALMKAIEVWLLIRIAGWMLGSNGWLATVCGLTVSLVSALCLPWYNPTVYMGVGSPNTWHSPTQLTVMVFMLLCVPMTARCVDTFQRQLPVEGSKANVPWRDVGILAALLFVSLTAKPTFMQAFLPAACLYFAVMWIRRPRNTPFILRMMVASAPAVLLMVLQYLYYFGIIVPSQGDMVVLVSWDKAADVAISVLLTRAFPLFVLLWIADREEQKKPLWMLTLTMEIVSIVEMLLLSETGRRASDGNFGWAMMGSALMFWALMLPLFCKQVHGWINRRRAAKQGQPFLENQPRAEALRLGIGSALLLWHLASGVYYLVYLLNTVNPL